MSYKVAIRKNSTGEVRISSYDFEWYKSAEYTDLFWWTEGNYGCDCNRHLEFERATGRVLEDHEISDAKCGEDAYTCLWAELPSGERIVIDQE